MKWTFTLVELFVVMVIVVIMLTILVPVFEQMGAGNRVDSTVKSIGSELSLARQYAQTNSTYVALIMPGAKDDDPPNDEFDTAYTSITSPTCANPPDLPAEYKFTTYRLAYVDLVGSDFIFDRWVEDSKWEFLPSGCTIMEADDEIGIQNGGVYVIQPNDNTISAVQNVPFGPPLVDSICNLEGDNIRAVIYSANGKLTPAGAFRYITVGEAQWTAASESFLIKNAVAASEPTKNESSANQITIEINGFTGGLSYSNPDNY